MTPMSPSMFDGCSPIEGSSSTYMTPVVRLRTDLASWTRCLSPVERVDDGRSRARYPSPRSRRRLAVSENDSQMLSAIWAISLGSVSGTPFTHSDSSDSVIWQALSKEIPLTSGSRAFSDSLVPLQQGQTPVLRNLSTRFIPFSSFTLARAFLTVLTAL